jgi:hypothetical protein
MDGSGRTRLVGEAGMVMTHSGCLCVDVQSQTSVRCMSDDTMWAGLVHCSWSMSDEWTGTPGGMKALQESAWSCWDAVVHCSTARRSSWAVTDAVRAPPTVSMCPGRRIRTDGPKVCGTTVAHIGREAGGMAWHDSPTQIVPSGLSILTSVFGRQVSLEARAAAISNGVSTVRPRLQAHCAVLPVRRV